MLLGTRKCKQNQSFCSQAAVLSRASHLSRVREQGLHFPRKPPISICTGAADKPAVPERCSCLFMWLNFTARQTAALLELGTRMAQGAEELVGN